MIEKKFIGGIVEDAPLWRGASSSDLKDIIKLMSDASYHYADDSTREWGKAALCKMQAAAKINSFKLDYDAIEALFREKRQLFALSDLINAVLKDARK